MLRVEGLPRADTRTVEGATVVTIGVFDGMHRGHMALLGRLRAVATAHSARTVVLTFRGHPDALVSGMAPAPLMTLDDRLERLEQAGVDATYVLDFDRSLMEMTAAEFHRAVLIEGLGCVALVFGYDAAICRRREGTVERFRELGLAAERIDRFVHRGHAVSASAIREALTRGELEVANEMLGYAYSLTGIVEHGDAR
ncbi:MAG: bifunctional riboflavin kinase/FMN adenylyltransferase, partial [Planctomycetes bacterium]|nr:bifunctional riboflavin kinase/FMN adenylyltransferase [Planctomycetota bacterium]